MGFDSLYKNYIMERENGIVWDMPEGFAIIKRIPEGFYLQDVYVLPQYRKTGIGRYFVEKLEELAKKSGESHIITSWSSLALGKEVSLEAITKVGFEPWKCEDNLVWFIKEIK